MWLDEEKVQNITIEALNRYENEEEERKSRFFLENDP